MKKGLKVLSTAGLAAVFAASVGVPTQAAVIDRVLEDTAGTVYQYDEVALGKSYTAFIVNEDSKGAALYKHYLNNIKNNPNAFVAFNDDKAGYVTYESVQKAFNKSIVAGEDFNLDNYTESGEGVTAEVKNYVNVTVGEDGAIVETPVTPPVEEVTVQSVSAINAIEVEFGTAVENVELPATVTATLNDEDSTEVELNVEWDESEEYDGNVAGTYTLTGTVTIPEDAEYTVSEEVAAISVDVVVAEPTETQISEAVAAINTADSEGIIAALQSPVLGLSEINEELADEYVLEISNSVTNTPARIQSAVNRVNEQAAEDAEAEQEAEQLLVDAVNDALNFGDLRTALLALDPAPKLAPNPTFNQLYFDAIDTNTTETKEQILEVINNVNVEQLTASVVKAETDLTQDAYNAATGLVGLNLLEEAVQTDLEDRLAAVLTAIATQDLVDDVNEATSEAELAAALLALQNAELIEGYTADNDTEYNTAFEALTAEPAFTKVSEIQELVTSVNAQAAEDALVAGVNDALANTDDAPTLEALNELAYAPFINLGTAKRADVAVNFYLVEKASETEFETTAEVKEAIDASIVQYNALLADINAAGSITEMQAALQAVADIALEVYTPAEVNEVDDSGKVTFANAETIFNALEALESGAFKTIKAALDTVTPEEPV